MGDLWKLPIFDKDYERYVMYEKIIIFRFIEGIQFVEELLKLL